MTNLLVPTIKDVISTLDTVKKSDDTKTLGSVLTEVDSSHAAVFVYNQADEFQGLVSPYKTIYSHNYPHTTLVSSILFHPPKIHKTAKFYEVAKHMIASKIYMLPVFTADDKVEGVVYEKDIMAAAVKDADLLAFIKDTVEVHKPVTAPATALVQDVFNQLKETGVSRLVLTDSKGALAGIVTRGDLMESVIKPTQKMRVPNEGILVGRNSNVGEKKSRKDEPVLKFSTDVVSTLPDTASMGEVVSHLVTSEHNSVVLVSPLNIPTGFMSTRDILQAIALMEPKQSVPVHIKKPSVSVDDAELVRTTEALEIFGVKLAKRVDIERIEVTTDEPKNQLGQTHEFNTTVLVIQRKGDPLVAKTKNRSFFDGVHAAIEVIEKQQRRTK